MEDFKTAILEELKEIKSLSLLAAKNVLTIEEVALLTGLSVSCLYKKTCAKQIPFYRSSKRIYFNRQEIEAWMMSVRVSGSFFIKQGVGYLQNLYII